MDEINITSRKTRFIPKFSSDPADGTVTYTCPEFFTPTGGSLTYTGSTVEGDEIYANKNEDASSRQGIFSLTATTNPSPDYEGTLTVTCAWTITQEGGSPSRVVTAITFNNLEWVTDIPWTGGTADTSNCSYNVLAIYNDGTEIDITDAATVTCNPVTVGETSNTERHEAGTLVLTATYRSGGVTFDDDESVGIWQSGKEVFSVSSLENNFLYTGGTQYITITNTVNHSWTVLDKPGWATLEPNQGNTSANVRVDVVARTDTATTVRNGIIVIRDTQAGENYRVPVKQNGHASPEVFNVSNLPGNFDYTGGTQYITITNTENHTWTVGEAPAWISLYPAQGNTGVDIKVDAAPRTDGSTIARTGVIVIRDNQTGEAYDVLAGQNGKDAPLVITVDWDYILHFVGNHGERVHTEFKIMSGGTTIDDVEIDEDGLNPRSYGDIFSGTTSITIPAEIYNRPDEYVTYYTYDTTTHSYVGGYMKITKGNGKLITTLMVPSMTPVEMQLIFQGFSDTQDRFDLVLSAQSVDHEDSIPVGDPAITPLTGISGYIREAGPVNYSGTTGEYVIKNISSYSSRMGYELQFDIDTAATHAFTTVKAVMEGSGGMTEIPVVRGGTGIYRVYLGDEYENFNQATVFIKFIEE